MSATNEELLQHLKLVLLSLEERFIAGISEFELISMLKQPPYNLVSDDALSDPLLLFQTHFIVFHALYQLRNEWRQTNVGELTIHATCIKLQHGRTDENNAQGNACIQARDQLAEYYLDWHNLVTTEQQDVDDLLANFWLKMAGYDASLELTKDEIETAKRNLELPVTSTLSLTELKQQYRKLQHQHHPDKGGDRDKSQLILQAYTKLHRYLSNRVD